MAVKFANLASSTLASSLSNTATSISVTSSSSFPTLGSGDYFYASIGESSGSEIVKVTGVSSNTFTVVRGQDGTSAQNWSSGSTIALRVVAAALDDIAEQAQTAADTESVSIDGDTMTGGLTVDLSTDSAFVSFERSGSEVGKIVHESGTSRLTMGTGNSGLTFIDSGQDRIVPRKSGGGNANASIDLGDGASQWREIYLSGGLRVNSQLVIDSSRNIANVGTISSGAITSSGTSSFANFRLTDTSKMGFGTVKAGATVNHTASVDEGIFWHTTRTYGVYRTSGAWSSPDYQQLRLEWDTGIELDGGSAYGKSGVTVTESDFLISNNASDPTLKFVTTSSSADPVLQMNGQSGIAAEGFEIWYDNTVGDVHLHTTFDNAAAAIRFHTRTAGSKATSNERFTITGDGHVLLAGDNNGFSPYMSRTNTNTLNAGYNWDSDAADFWINYRGYLDGTSRFRDFRVGDGKNVGLIFVDGSTREVDFQNGTDILVGGTTVIDSSRNLENIASAAFDDNPEITWGSNNLTLKSRNAIGVVTLAGNGTYKTRLDITNVANTSVIGRLDPVGGSSFLQGNWNLTTGDLQLNGTTRISNAGNATLGTISSGAITSTGKSIFTGDNSTDGTLRLVPNSNKGSNVSHIHYGSTGDWYIRSASTSGTVHIQDNGGGTVISGDLTVGGNLLLTGDINQYNVTDLDVTDKTITVNAGGTQSLSDGAGLIIDRGTATDASILWDETNDHLVFNTYVRSGDTVEGGGADKQLLAKGAEADIWLTSTGGGSGTWRVMGSTGNATKLFRIYDHDAGANRFTIDTSGNVTISGNITSGAILSNSHNVGIKFGTTHVKPSNNSGGDADNHADLGTSSTRWKNLYLSGTISSGALSATGNSTITGSGSSSNALNVYRGSDSTSAFRVLNTGEVLVSSNYFYVDASQGAYFNGAVRARGGITNDGGNNLSISSGGSDITFNSKNFTSVGTISSGAITASGSSVFNPTSDMVIVNEPSTNTDLQTVMRVGTSSGGLFLTTNNAIIGKGAYYDGGWVATSTSGSYIDFAGNDRITFNTFSGATVGGAAAFGARAYIDSAGLNVTGTVYSGGTLTVNGNNLIVSGGGAGDGKLYFSGYGSASEYNYFLKADNDTGRKAVMFVNGSTRTGDGGANTFTIRNDGGPLRLGNSNYVTTIEGSSFTVPSVTSLSAISARTDYDLSTQGNAQLVLYDNTTDTLNMRFGVDTAIGASGGGSIQVTQSGVSNDRDLKLNPYGGKVGVNVSSGTALSYNFNVSGTSYISGKATFDDAVVADTLHVRGDAESGYAGGSMVGGISLWGPVGQTTSQIMFKPTSAGSPALGNHGFCTDSYNTYFVMDTTNRGWVFRNATTDTNVASISNTGGAAFNNGIKIGTQTIVDSNRNLTNIASISSAGITSSGNITSTGYIDAASYVEANNYKVNTVEVIDTNRVLKNITRADFANFSVTGTSTVDPSVLRYANIGANPEGSHLSHPFFFNDLANFEARGGTVTVSGLNGGATLTECFRANGRFSSWSNGSYTGSTMTITLTNLPHGLSYGGYIGIAFGNTSWCPASCKIEVSTDGGSTWTTRLNSASAKEMYFTTTGTGGTAANAIRFTIGQAANTTSIRCTHIWAYNYNSNGMEDYFLSKGGGTVYGTITSQGLTTSGHITMTSNGHSVNTRSVLARDANGLNLGATNGTTAISIDNSSNVSMPYSLTVTGAISSSSSMLASKGYFGTASNAVPATVYVKSDGANNLQRWGSGDVNNANSYRFRIDQNFNFIGNNGSGADKVTIYSSSGNILTAGNIITGNQEIDVDDNTGVVLGAPRDAAWVVSSGVGGKAAGTGDTWAIGHNGNSLYYGIGNGSSANSLSTYMVVNPQRVIYMENKLTVGDETYNDGHLHVYSEDLTTDLVIDNRKTYGSGQGTADRARLIFSLSENDTDVSAQDRHFFRIDAGTTGESSSANGFAQFFVRQSGTPIQVMQFRDTGAVSISGDGTSYSYGMQRGALELGSTSRSYKYTGGWASTMQTGILANTAANWEIAVHDAGDSVNSLILYENDGANVAGNITIGRNLGWGANDVIFGAGITTAALHTTGTSGSTLAGGSIDTQGGTINTGRVLFSGYNDSGADVYGFNNESNQFVLFNYTDSQYIMKVDGGSVVEFPTAVRFTHPSNYITSITNVDAGSTHFNHRGNRLLTSNGSNWAADGRDPMFAFTTSGNSNATTIGHSIGITMHNESTTNNTFSPMIAFSNQSNSGNYNTAYAAILGKKTGSGVDANWSTGELWFYAMPASNYAQNLPNMRITGDDVEINGSLDSPNDTGLIIRGKTRAGVEYDPVIQLLNEAATPSEGLELWFDNSTGHSYMTNKIGTSSLYFSTGTGSALKSQSNVRFEITGAGHVKLGGNSSETPYISRSNTNTLNAGWGQNVDTADMWINYRGYQDGTTRFRDFRIGNGKNAELVHLDGSANRWYWSNGTEQFNWKIHADNDNTNASWDDLEFQATDEWGDGQNYGVLGGSTGVMLRRPHVVWSSSDNTADIRFGRSGGTSTGSWYGVGTLASNEFSIHKDAKTGAILKFDGSSTWHFQTNNIALNAGIRFQDSANRAISGNSIGSSYHVVEITGNWDKFQVMGRVLDWSASNLHFGDGYNGIDHSSYYFRIGAVDYMQVGGDFYATGNVIAYYSDARLKKNVETIPNALDIVKGIRGVYFEWNEKSEEVWSRKDGEKDFGLISQEVEAVFPMGVAVQAGADKAKERGYGDPDSEFYDPLHKGENEEEQYKTVKYDKMVAVALQAIKEQQELIESQQAQIDELKTLVHNLLEK